MCVEPGIDAVYDLFADGRIHKIGRADFNGRGSGHEEFDGVSGIHDTAQSDNRDFDRACHLPHHTQGDGFHGRAGQTAGSDTEHGAAPLDVDGHAHERVDKRYGVGAAVLDSAGDVSDTCHVGRQFHDECLGISGPHGADNRCGAFARHAESHAAILDVGTRDVELDGGDTVERSDARGTLGALAGAFITAGSVFTGEFDFNMLGALQPGGALLQTHFGILYDKKPVKFKGVYKYTPGTPFVRTTGTGSSATNEETDEVDECAIQAVLYTVTSEDETLDGTNIDSDDARIVARARLEDGSAKEDWTNFELDFTWTEGASYDSNLTYKLAIVCSASKDGANFNGAVNSTLIVDNLEIVGE